MFDGNGRLAETNLSHPGFHGITVTTTTYYLSSTVLGGLAVADLNGSGQKSAAAEFPLLQVINRQPEERGETIEALKPAYHYNSSSIRQQWKEIRSSLERNKVPTNAALSDVRGEITLNGVKLVSNSAARSGSLPVLIANTFNPNWQRSDGNQVYAATPFYILTFVDRLATISYGRRWFDRVGLWTSAGTLILLCLFTAWHLRRDL